MENQNLNPDHQPNLSPPTHPHKHFYFGIAIAALLAGGALTLIAIQNFKTDEDILASESPVTSNSQNQALLETKGWKTYRNEKYRFEVKYPNNWFIQENGGYGPWVFQSNDFSNNIHGIGLPPIGDMRVNIAPPEACKDYDKGFINEKENLQVDITERILCKYNFQITLDVWNKDLEYNQHKELLNQILSTFKFIEPQAQVDPSAWKIYRNEEYGFELKYLDNSVVEQSEIRDNIQSIRIQNYVADDSSNVLNPGEYYLEMYNSKNDSCHGNIEEEGSRPINLGQYEGYRGYAPEGGDSGGIRFALCVDKVAGIDNSSVYIIVTENNPKGLIANKILDSLKF